MSNSNDEKPSPSETRFPELLARIERREQSARRRALLYALLPIALTAALLWYTAERVSEAQGQVRHASEQVTALNAVVLDYQSQVQALESTLAQAKEKLAAATDLVQYTRPIGYVDAKSLASRFPGSEALLMQMLSLRERGTAWKLGGQSPAEGFDSPSFAMYILRETGAAAVRGESGETLLVASRRLFEALPPINAPRTGDLVFYPAGYVLFYFDDRREGPFVMGMTPFGITALRPDFAKPVGYRRVDR